MLILNFIKSSSTLLLLLVFWRLINESIQQTKMQSTAPRETVLHSLSEALTTEMHFSEGRQDSRDFSFDQNLVESGLSGPLQNNRDLNRKAN